MKSFSTHHLFYNSYYFQYPLLLYTSLVIEIKNCRYFVKYYCSSFYCKQATPNIVKNLYTSPCHHGFTFLEVLIALFILATGILGAVGIQITAQKGSFNAVQRTIATLYAQDIIAKMKSNSPELIILEKYEGVYDSNTLIIPAKRCNQVGNLCTAEERVANDLYELNKRLIGADVTRKNENVGGLIKGKACILHSNNKVTVHIVWRHQNITTNSSVAGSVENLKANCEIKNSSIYSQVVVTAFVY